MNPGNYTVKCLYGDSTSSVASMIPASCTKTIQAKSSTDSTAQGCDRIYAYKGQTLSNEMMNNTAFDASFRCGSRQDVTAQNFPFRLSV
jgi:hypothetical protein